MAALILCVFRTILEEDPFTRIKQVVRWYVAGFYKKPKVIIIQCTVFICCPFVLSCFEYSPCTSCVFRDHALDVNSEGHSLCLSTMLLLVQLSLNNLMY